MWRYVKHGLAFQRRFNVSTIAQALTKEVSRILNQYLKPVLQELKEACAADDEDGQVLLSVVQGMLGNAEVAGTRHAVQAGKLAGTAELRGATAPHSILAMSPNDTEAADPESVSFTELSVLPLEVVLRLRPSESKRARVHEESQTSNKSSRSEPG